jgi:hypothetical protein
MGWGFGSFGLVGLGRWTGEGTRGKGEGGKRKSSRHGTRRTNLEIGEGARDCGVCTAGRDFDFDFGCAGDICTRLFYIGDDDDDDDDDADYFVTLHSNRRRSWRPFERLLHSHLFLSLSKNPQPTPQSPI